MSVITEEAKTGESKITGGVAVPGKEGQLNQQPAGTDTVTPLLGTISETSTMDLLGTTDLLKDSENDQDPNEEMSEDEDQEESCGVSEEVRKQVFTELGKVSTKGEVQAYLTSMASQDYSKEYQKTCDERCVPHKGSVRKKMRLPRNIPTLIQMDI